MLPPSQPINRTPQPPTGPIGGGAEKSRLTAKFDDVPRKRQFIPPLKSAELDDVTFWNEVRAYASIPNTARERYAGKYVAVYHGDIVDSDAEEVSLVERFYRTFGYVPVLIHKVGIEDGVIDELE
jgi:hypothetical protein